MIEKTSAIHYQTFTQSERIKITLYSLGTILSLAFVLLCLCVWCTWIYVKYSPIQDFQLSSMGKIRMHFLRYFILRLDWF